MYSVLSGCLVCWPAQPMWGRSCVVLVMGNNPIYIRWWDQVSQCTFQRNEVAFLVLQRPDQDASVWYIYMVSSHDAKAKF